jgi:hypothetical protein
MAKSRKTVDIESILNYANGYLASDYPGGDTKTEIHRRQGVIDMIETILMKANRYRGFLYLNDTQITKSIPGIRPYQDKMFENTDSTRRRYV